MDDVMKALTGKYGGVSRVAEYLSKIKGHWVAVPFSSGSQNKGPCARISAMKALAGIDVVKMYPAAQAATPEADHWTWETFLKAAEACDKGGMTFGIGDGQTPDSVDFAGALFASFGADLVDGKGNITLDTDAVRQALDYAQRLVRFLPKDAVSYDDASNNRALISGKSALIFNPPSAWAVAKRDAPRVAEDCWTFPAPLGPAGRFTPTLTFFWGIYNFSQNQAAAKELIEYLLQREQIEERANAVEGYDLPPFPSMSDFTIWERVQPPPGTVYNYPIRPWHHAQPSLTGSEAKPEIAVQIYQHAIHNNMLARMKHGQSIEQAMAWAQDELEGFKM
jgi:ABC-type glycerol-3-phosphate transport system substrate-binding protein